MSAIPEVLDALTRLWQTSPGVAAAGIRPDQVLDGPPVTFIGSEGVSVGTSREDNSVEFTRAPSGMVDSDEQFSIACLVWSGSGDTIFKPLRDRVDAILTALDNALSGDRTLSGNVSNAWVTSGAVVQEQTGQGALVTLEFTIDATIY